MRRRGRGLTATLTLGFLFALPALAQGPPVTASVDRGVVRANESFVYLLRAEGEVTGDPEIAPLAALTRSASIAPLPALAPFGGNACCRNPPGASTP